MSMLLVVPAFWLFMIASMWKVFNKAGQAGWKCLVPIYNIHVMTKIAKVSPWMTLMLFVPILGFIAAWKISDGTARKFGKGMEYSLGLFLLAPVFYPILAFGSAKYVKPKPKNPTSTTPATKIAA